jgi:ElaB/YqjD/DUF883 family membrane-anchored ribosome-binding protein
MDEQRAGNTAKDAVEQASKTASDAVAQVGATVQAKLDQGRTMAQDMRTGAQETIDKATTLARQVTESGGQAASRAGEVIQGVARDVGGQASQAANNLYQQGSLAGGYIARYTAEQPVTALLIAGLIGYGLAYLIHRRP